MWVVGVEAAAVSGACSWLCSGGACSLRLAAGEAVSAANPPHCAPLRRRDGEAGELSADVIYARALRLKRDGSKAPVCLPSPL